MIKVKALTATALFTKPRIQNPVENNIIFYWIFILKNKGE